MRRHVLLDTGPLVAFLNRREEHHEWARDVLATMAPPLRTCESVLSEACFLLRTLPGGREAVLELLSQGLIAAPFRLEEEALSLRKLMKKYSDVPMSLADACLVRMCEKDTKAVVLTLDRDFLRYRKNGREVIDVLSPDDA